MAARRDESIMACGYAAPVSRATHDFFVFWFGEILRQHRETAEAIARLDRFHHVPAERERLERRLSEEKRAIGPVIFSRGVGPALGHVHLVPPRHA